MSITTNVLEGTLAKDLTEIQARYPEMDIGSYPRFVDGRGITTLVFRSTDTSKNAAAAAEARAMIAALGGEILPEPAAA